MVESKEDFMQMALDKAWAYQGLTYPNPPVGAVVTDKNNNFISFGVHKSAGCPHAEVNAIKNAYYKLSGDECILELEDATKIHNYLYTNHNNLFEDKTIFVTLEPCNHFGKTPPCSQLIKKLKFNKVVIGTLDTNKKASGGKEFLEEAGLHVEVGVLGVECKELLCAFTKWQKSNFVFFKLAMSNNGVVDGGIITSRDSRALVHKLRDKTDLLVIGGNTVRLDRPALDARMCAGVAPDILIYSKSKSFDKTIPLFHVKDRTVHVADNFEILKDYKFIMIEGVEAMLKETKDITDAYLFFRSPNLKEGNSPKIELNLKEVFSSKIGEDRYTWYKKH